MESLAVMKLLFGEVGGTRTEAHRQIRGAEVVNDQLTPMGATGEAETLPAPGEPGAGTAPSPR